MTMSDDLIANGEKDGAKHAGPVLLFVHGFLDSGEVWTRVRQELSGKGLATATLDLRGHGTRTDEPGELSLDAFARDVVAIIDHLDREIILVGQSMGAQIAELAAVSRPDRVSGLVLLTPIPLGGVNAPEEAMAPFKELGGSAERQIQQRQALSHAIGRDDLAWLGGVGASVAPEVVREVAEVWNRGHEAGARPSAYSGPTLVVRGVSDPFVDSAMIARVVSGSRVRCRPTSRTRATGPMSSSRAAWPCFFPPSRPRLELAPKAAQPWTGRARSQTGARPPSAMRWRRTSFSRPRFS